MRLGKIKQGQQQGSKSKSSKSKQPNSKKQNANSSPKPKASASSALSKGLTQPKLPVPIKGTPNPALATPVPIPRKIKISTIDPDPGTGTGTGNPKNSISENGSIATAKSNLSNRASSLASTDASSATTASPGLDPKVQSSPTSISREFKIKQNKPPTLEPEIPEYLGGDIPKAWLRNPVGSKNKDGGAGAVMPKSKRKQRISPSKKYKDQEPKKEESAVIESYLRKLESPAGSKHDVSAGVNMPGRDATGKKWVRSHSRKSTNQSSKSVNNNNPKGLAVGSGQRLDSEAPQNRSSVSDRAFALNPINNNNNNRVDDKFAEQRERLSLRQQDMLSKVNSNKFPDELSISNNFNYGNEKYGGNGTDNNYDFIPLQYSSSLNLPAKVSRQSSGYIQRGKSKYKTYTGQTDYDRPGSGSSKGQQADGQGQAGSGSVGYDRERYYKKSVIRKNDKNNGKGVTVDNDGGRGVSIASSRGELAGAGGGGGGGAPPAIVNAARVSNGSVDGTETKQDDIPSGILGIGGSKLDGSNGSGSGGGGGSGSNTLAGGGLNSTARSDQTEKVGGYEKGSVIGSGKDCVIGVEAGSVGVSRGSRSNSRGSGTGSIAGKSGYEVDPDAGSPEDTNGDTEGRRYSPQNLSTSRRSNTTGEDGRACAGTGRTSIKNNAFPEPKAPDTAQKSLLSAQKMLCAAVEKLVSMNSELKYAEKCQSKAHLRCVRRCPRRPRRGKMSLKCMDCSDSNSENTSNVIPCRLMNPSNGSSSTHRENCSKNVCKLIPQKCIVQALQADLAGFPGQNLSNRQVLSCSTACSRQGKGPGGRPACLPCQRQARSEDGHVKSCELESTLISALVELDSRKLNNENSPMSCKSGDIEPWNNHELLTLPYPQQQQLRHSKNKQLLQPQDCQHVRPRQQNLKVCPQLLLSQLQLAQPKLAQRCWQLQQEQSQCSQCSTSTMQQQNSNSLFSQLLLHRQQELEPVQEYQHLQPRSEQQSLSLPPQHLNRRASTHQFGSLLELQPQSQQRQLLLETQQQQLTLQQQIIDCQQNQLQQIQQQQLQQPWEQKLPGRWQSQHHQAQPLQSKLQPPPYPQEEQEEEEEEICEPILPQNPMSHLEEHPIKQQLHPPGCIAQFPYSLLNESIAQFPISEPQDGTFHKPIALLPLSLPEQPIPEEIPDHWPLSHPQEPTHHGIIGQFPISEPQELTHYETNRQYPFSQEQQPQTCSASCAQCPITKQQQLIPPQNFAQYQLSLQKQQQQPPACPQPLLQCQLPQKQQLIPPQSLGQYPRSQQPMLIPPQSFEQYQSLQAQQLVPPYSFAQYPQSQQQLLMQRQSLSRYQNLQGHNLAQNQFQTQCQTLGDQQPIQTQMYLPYPYSQANDPIYRQYMPDMPQDLSFQEKQPFQQKNILQDIPLQGNQQRRQKSRLQDTPSEERYPIRQKYRPQETPSEEKKRIRKNKQLQDPPSEEQQSIRQKNRLKDAPSEDKQTNRQKKLLRETPSEETQPLRKKPGLQDTPSQEKQQRRQKNRLQETASEEKQSARPKTLLQDTPLEDKKQRRRKNRLQDNPSDDKQSLSQKNPLQDTPSQEKQSNRRKKLPQDTPSKEKQAIRQKNRLQDNPSEESQSSRTKKLPQDTPSKEKQSIRQKNRLQENPSEESQLSRQKKLPQDTPSKEKQSIRQKNRLEDTPSEESQPSRKKKQLKVTLSEEQQPTRQKNRLQDTPSSEENQSVRETTGRDPPSEDERSFYHKSVPQDPIAKEKEKLRLYSCPLQTFPQEQQLLSPYSLQPYPLLQEQQQLCQRQQTCILQNPMAQGQPLIHPPAPLVCQCPDPMSQTQQPVYPQPHSQYSLPGQQQQQLGLQQQAPSHPDQWKIQPSQMWQSGTNLSMATPAGSPSPKQRQLQQYQNSFPTPPPLPVAYPHPHQGQPQPLSPTRRTGALYQAQASQKFDFGLHANLGDSDHALTLNACISSTVELNVVDTKTGTAEMQTLPVPQPPPSLPFRTPQVQQSVGLCGSNKNCALQITSVQQHDLKNVQSLVTLAPPADYKLAPVSSLAPQQKISEIEGENFERGGGGGGGSNKNVQKIRISQQRLRMSSPSTPHNISVQYMPEHLSNSRNNANQRKQSYNGPVIDITINADAQDDNDDTNDEDEE